MFNRPNFLFGQKAIFRCVSDLELLTLYNHHHQIKVQESFVRGWYPPSGTLAAFLKADIACHAAAGGS